MNGSSKRILAVRSAAHDLEEKGYSVVVEPDPSLIPFDLHRYRPDILATRENENLIIEFKTKDYHQPIERYKEIADIIGSHKNWRFMLSTIDEEGARDFPLLEHQVDRQTLTKMLDKLERLLSEENYGLMLPYLWSVYISAMRIVGATAGIPVDAISDRSVLNYMYSLGELSHDDFESAKKFLDLRNKAVHSFEFDIPKKTFSELYNDTKAKLQEWNLME